MPHIVEVATYTVDIYIGGDSGWAKETCRGYCDAIGLCVTPTTYVYSGGYRAADNPTVAA